jgi:hypothetical protein
MAAARVARPIARRPLALQVPDFSKSARYGGIAIKSRRAQARDERAAAELKRARERPLGV